MQRLMFSFKGPERCCPCNKRVLQNSEEYLLPRSTLGMFNYLSNMLEPCTGKSFVLNLLTMTSWSFVSLFASLVLMFFCVSFKKLVHVMDSTEDSFSDTDLEIKVNKLRMFLIFKMLEECIYNIYSVPCNY